MTNADIDLLQQQLVDIYQPESASWWPLTPAWWLLILISILSISSLIYLYYKKTALRRYTLKQLQIIEKGFLEHGNINQLAMSLDIILRRVVLSQKTRQCSPGLIGKAWLNYLDKYSASNEFSLGVGQQLLYLPYQKPGAQSNTNSSTALKLIALVKQWVIKNT